MQGNNGNGKNNKGARITPRSKDYSQWYLDVIREADLADHASVKGCMVIKPYGYAIWENFQKILDEKIKKTGHQNAYFPLFIPKSFLSKEAKHVEGFAKECAVVTHYRLKNDPDGNGVIVDPEAKLQEELIIRPTSETIIYSTISKWIESYRDLPILINQWANVVRWEMRTRLFLRTTEFLWQEGHTAHRTEREAEGESLMMLEVYRKFSEEYLAMPVVPGQKSESEKFAGALRTYTIEAMMQDGKALQAGTSHNLGQNFAESFDVKFRDEDGEIKYVWQTSWGVSTRFIGGLIMTHSDNDGLVLPPRIAPIQVVVVPIWKNEGDKMAVFSEIKDIVKELEKVDVRIKIDDREYCTPGFKFHEWEAKGVPLRVEVGPRDVANESLVVARRDTKEKVTISRSKMTGEIRRLLDTMQKDLLERARKSQEDRSYRIDDYEEFKKVLEEMSGFIYSHWCGSEMCEEEINNETRATIRCIPFNQKEEVGQCIKCGKDSRRRVIFAKAY
jgi:prolyl-tRNA synthetase